MGPSGSGKTTFLNELAGRIPAAKNITLSGSVAVNSASINNVTLPVSYVTRQGLFFSQLTVRETLDMAALMRLPQNMTAQQHEALVDALVRKLGLVAITESPVGDSKTRGISIGEKKHISLDIKLISSSLCDSACNSGTSPTTSV